MPEGVEADRQAAAFISYASADATAAAGVCQALEQGGIRCWMAPRDVLPGTFYADAIVGAINASRVLVLVLSQNSVASPHVVREVERASSKQRPIVTFRIDSAALPPGLEYFLSASHWLDASQGAGQGYPALVDAVRRLTAAGTAPETAPLRPAATTGSAAAGAARPAGTATARPTRTRALTASAAALVIAIAIGGFALYRGLGGKHDAVASGPGTAAGSTAQQSIAVLPFADLSERKDQEYFSDGLSDELIDLLGRIPGLRVPARTSAFYFKGRQATLADVGKALNVTHVLEGSVRKSGNALRVTAELVRVEGDARLWSQTYDRELNDLFKVQDDIAGAVVEQLKLTLLTSAAAPVAATSTVNPAAHNLFLQAKYYAARDDEQGLDKAVALLQQAIALDPQYALAYAKLGDVYGRRVANGRDTDGTGDAKIRAAGERAIELAPNLPNGYMTLAIAHLQYDLDWAAAARLVQKARALDPDDSEMLEMSAHLAQATGTVAESEAWFRRAIDKDPLNLLPRRYLARLLYYDNRLADAEALLRHSIEVNPGYNALHYELARALLASGDPAGALAAAELETSPAWKSFALPLVYHALNRTDDANKALAYLLANSAGSEFQVAETYAYFGQPDEAFRWLELARTRHDPGLIYIRRDPLLRPLEHDSRYRAFLKKLNLPV